MIREKHIDSLLQPRQLKRVYTRIANNSAFTLIELVVVVVIIMILATLAFFGYTKFVGKAQVITAISEINGIVKDVRGYQIDNGDPPVNLVDADAAYATLLDPWGNLYQYAAPPVRTQGGSNINSQFDVFSMGKDGLWVPDINAPQSLDDIIRAGDDKYLGKASGY